MFNLSNGFNLFGQRLQILLDGFVLLDPWLPTIISAVHYDVSHFFHSVSQCERVSSAAVGELSEHAGSGWETLCFGNSTSIWFLAVIMYSTGMFYCGLLRIYFPYASVDGT